MSHRDVPWLATLAFILLGTVYGALVPLYESPDEPQHIALVAHLAEAWSWPRQQPGMVTPWLQEASQPPLYYGLLAGLTRLFGWPTDDLEKTFRPNPFARPGDLSAEANKNVALHGPRESFPWSGPVLTVHLWREVSLLLAAATIPALYGLGRTLFPHRPTWALGAVLLAVFNPAFVFNMARVSNDALVVPLATWGLWILARLGSRKDPAWGLAAAAGILAGLAGLAKLSGLVLLPAAALVVLIRAIHYRRSPQEALLEGICLLAPVALVCGWWFWQNFSFYGDPTGLNVMVEVAGPRRESSGLWVELRGTVWSYWALFGWMNLGPEPAVLHLLEVATFLGLGAAAVFTIRRSSRADPGLFGGLSLLWVYVGLLVAAFIRWTSLTPASDGRLLYPAVGPVALLLFIGWEAFTGRWLLTRPIPWLLVAGLGLLTVTAPFRYILPAYAGPEPTETVPAGARPVNATFGNHLRLIAYEPGAAGPGESLRLTLYWECLTPTAEPWALFFHQVGDAGGAAVPNLDTFPGRGLMSTTDCRPGYRFADRYAFRITGVPEGTVVVRLRVGLRVPPVGGEAVPVTGPAGRPLEALVIEAGKVRGWGGAGGTTQGPALGPLRLKDFDLPKAARAGETLPVRTVWEVAGPTADDWRFFVHLGDPTRPPLAQADGPPANGNFPAQWWEVGDILVDRREIPLPPDLPQGRYPVTVGLYRPDGVRATAEGSGLSYIRLGEVEVAGY
ncbi:MAG: hypothetical protein C4315_06830 [Chloroflexota bacterium]